MKDKKILIICVIYNINLQKSSSYNCLLKAINSGLLNDKNSYIIIYDNGPLSNNKHFNIPNGEYIFDKNNSGLAIAYNLGLSKACENELKWMLTLDQDSIFNEDFINEIFSTLEEKDLKEVVSIVPHMYDQHNFYFSPTTENEKREYVKRDFSGKLCCGGAINSCTTISVDFLNEIGGYNLNFPLDGLDHWLSYQIRANNKKILVMKTAIKHSLSVSDLTSINVKRYISYLESECKLYVNYYSYKKATKHAVTMLHQGLAIIFKQKHYKIGIITLKMGLKLLFFRRQFILK